MQQLTGLDAAFLAMETRTVFGNDVLAALLDLSPEGRKLPDPPPHRTERQPGAVELLARSAVFGWLIDVVRATSPPR